MNNKIHIFRKFISKHKVLVSFMLSFILFIFLISNFPTRATRYSGVLIFSEDMIGKQLTVFIISLIWFGLFYLFLEYNNSKEFDNDIKQYEDAKSLVYSEAAIELQDKSKIKMDVWGKAILEAKGNEELAKAKYIEIRIKEFEKQINQKINE